MDPEKIANNARAALSNFCIEECGAYCCQKGYIIVTPEEMKTMVKGKEEILLKEDFLKPLVDGKYSLFLGNSHGGCPSLKNKKCTIYKNSNRPKTCHEFPLFIQGKSVRFSDRCPAKKTMLLYPFLRELKQMGYEII